MLAPAAPLATNNVGLDFVFGLFEKQFFYDVPKLI